MSERLMMAGSERRAPVLVDVLRETESDDEARELLRDWFNMSEAISPWTAELREQFERVGYVTDDEDFELELPVTVYRAAYEDDDVESALSWTTSLETAHFFARHHTSIRAAFLGLYRDDVDMVIWRDTMHEAHAYFNGRGEHEVVPRRITDIEAIQKLARAEEVSEGTRAALDAAREWKGEAHG